jgi:diguanylate cyclase (GGDEF)-like protein
MIDSGLENPKRPANPAQRRLRIVSSDGRRDAAAAPVIVSTAQMQAPPAPKNSRATISGDAFDDLFDALKARLRMTAAEWPNPAAGSAGASSVQQVNATILECAAALDHVQATLTPDIIRLRHLERELREVSASLAQAQAELAGTQLKERQARHLAMHDVLTSLPNRRFFLQRLDLALAPSNRPTQALAVLYIDLNGFKAMNDTHGHHMGDQLLQIVAARLKNAVRAEDMVCRLGGDEFGCLLAGLPNRRGISHVAAKVFGVLSAPLTIGPLNLSILPSIGIAVSPDDGATGDALLRRADAAMYHAKHYQTRYTFFREALQKG